MERDSLQAHLDARFDRLDSRLENLGDKLDNHLDRISKTETELHWIKGVSKFGITLIITVAGFVAKILWSQKWQ